MNTNKNFDVSNWVPVKMIILPASLAVVFLVFQFVNVWFLLGTLVFTAAAVYFFAAHRLFSPRGGNLQVKVRAMILDKLKIPLDKPVRVLDIGCGNGPLTIETAQRYPKAELAGVDLWGRNWDYSMQVCQKNAQLAGVAERMTFKKASAEALPFADGHFDVVLSNLVFHEARGVKDKRMLVREALRVLKPGGIFILQDLFLLQAYYGTEQDLVDTVKSWGISKVDFERTCEQDFIPGWVKLPFMLGTLAILHGVK